MAPPYVLIIVTVIDLSYRFGWIITMQTSNFSSFGSPHYQLFLRSDSILSTNREFIYYAIYVLFSGFPERLENALCSSVCAHISLVICLVILYHINKTYACNWNIMLEKDDILIFLSLFRHRYTWYILVI